MEGKEKTLEEPKTLEEKNKEDWSKYSRCRHEWRIVPDFFDGSKGRDIRTYVFYCIRCLESKTATLSRLKNFN